MQEWHDDVRIHIGISRLHRDGKRSERDRVRLRKRVPRRDVRHGVHLEPTLSAAKPVHDGDDLLPVGKL